MDAIILGLSGPGKSMRSRDVDLRLGADLGFSIFRTDYGHTEVAAYFGNGKSPLNSLRSIFSNLELRPSRVLHLDEGLRR